ncbi:MAG: class I SAM-dependent methyltransferase [Kiritimatiellae bacterium]|nr:class I SAM-dependent methyltransferase [Kiritimatiellia bacterium]
MKLAQLINRLLRPFGAQVMRVYADQDKDWDHSFLSALKYQQEKGADPNEYLDQVWGRAEWEHYYDPLVKQGDVVVEIGPGLGRWTKPILDRVGKLYVVDYSRHVCNWWADKNDPRIEIIHTVNCRMPTIPANSVDLLMSWDVFVHIGIEVLYGYLQETFRILKPGGVAIIDYLAVLNPDAVARFKKDMEHRYGKGEVEPSIFKYHHPQMIEMLARDLGFQVTHTPDKWKTHVICKLVKPG